MTNVMQLGLNAQGFTVEANQDNLEEDDLLFPDEEDFDSKADRLYDEYVAKAINS